MNKPLITLKIVGKNGQKVRTFVTRKTKRIYSFLKAEKNMECVFRLTVRYGNGSTNEGRYKTTDDLIYALKAFTEPD